MVEHFREAALASHGQVHETYHGTKGVSRSLQSIYDQAYFSKLINLTRLKRESQHTNQYVVPDQ